MPWVEDWKFNEAEQAAEELANNPACHFCKGEDTKLVRSSERGRDHFWCVCNFCFQKREIHTHRPQRFTDNPPPDMKTAGEIIVASLQAYAIEAAQ